MVTQVLVALLLGAFIGPLALRGWRRQITVRIVVKVLLVPLFEVCNVSRLEITIFFGWKFECINVIVAFAI